MLSLARASRRATSRSVSGAMLATGRCSAAGTVCSPASSASARVSFRRASCSRNSSRCIGGRRSTCRSSTRRCAWARMLRAWTKWAELLVSPASIWASALVVGWSIGRSRRRAGTRPPSRPWGCGCLCPGPPLPRFLPPPRRKGNIGRFIINQLGLSPTGPSPGRRRHDFQGSKGRLGAPISGCGAKSRPTLPTLILADHRARPDRGRRCVAPLRPRVGRHKGLAPLLSAKQYRRSLENQAEKLRTTG